MRSGVLLQMVGLPPRADRAALLSSLARILPNEAIPSVELANSMNDAKNIFMHGSGTAVLRFKQHEDVQRLLSECDSSIDIEVEREHDPFNFDFDEAPVETVRANLVQMTEEAEIAYWDARKEIEEMRKQRKAKKELHKQQKNATRSQPTLVRCFSSASKEALETGAVKADEGGIVAIPLSPQLPEPRPFPCTRRNKARPSLDDVMKLSRGEGTRKKVGSRQVPHRLNAEEVRRFKLARKNGYLTVQGTGYRRERKGSPLLNLHRQLCDAQAGVVIRVEQWSGKVGTSSRARNISKIRSRRRGQKGDHHTDSCDEDEVACAEVWVDFSPLRLESYQLDDSVATEWTKWLQQRYTQLILEAVSDKSLDLLAVQAIGDDGTGIVKEGVAADGGSGAKGTGDSRAIWEIAPIGLVARLGNRSDARKVAQFLAEIGLPCELELA